MGTLETQEIFPPKELGEQLVNDEFPQLQLESLSKRSKLHLRRKTASISSLLYPPPRSKLPAVKHSSSTQLNMIKVKDADKRKKCKCKQSRCLKLYCLCFSSGKYCDGCCCSSCQNNVENDDARRFALELILQRSKNAFRAILSNSGKCSLDNQIVRSEETRPLKLIYRSISAGIIEPQLVRELCALLVITSEAAKDSRCPVILSNPSFELTQKNSEAQKAEFKGGPEDHGATKSNGSSCRILVDIKSKDSNSKAVVPKETPVAPEALLPICHGKAKYFPQDAPFDKNLNNGCYLDTCIEQERLVLATFLDFLNKLDICRAQK